MKQSVLQQYREAAKLRTLEAFQNTDIEFCQTNADMLCFIRKTSTTNGQDYLIVMNIGNQPSTLSLPTNDDRMIDKIILSNLAYETDTFTGSELRIKPGDYCVAKLFKPDKTEL